MLLDLTKAFLTYRMSREIVKNNRRFKKKKLTYKRLTKSIHGDDQDFNDEMRTRTDELIETFDRVSQGFAA